MDIALKGRSHSLGLRRVRGALGRKPVRAVLVLGVVLLGLRFLVSPLLTRAANRRLSDLPEYAGHVGRVTLAGWRGAIEVHDFSLWVRGHEADGPIVLMKQGALSPAWLQLLRGRLGGTALVEEAEVMLLQDSPAEQPPKSAEEKERLKQEKLAAVRRWQGALQKAFPLELTRFEIANSRVRFRDRSTTPHPEIAIEGLHVVLTGLGRRPANHGDLPATARLDGVLTGHGRLVASARADPLAARPRFEAQMEVQRLSLPAIRDFMRSYAKVDVTAGTFEVFVEVSASEGRYAGYVKPFFRDLEFKPVRDENQNVVERLATSAASAMTSLLKNEDDKVATKVPFEGNFADNDVDVWTTIENLLRNAFVQSLQEGLEGQRPVR